MRSTLLKLLSLNLLILMLVAIPYMTACEGEEGEPLEVIELTYAAEEGPTAAFSLADMIWIEKIEEETGGRVKITPYWGGTLLSLTEGYEELVQGAADIAKVSIEYGSAPGFDILRTMGSFYYGATSLEQTRLVDEAIRELFPEIDGEMSAVKILGYQSVTAYQLHTRDTPVRTLADLEGLQIKAIPMYTGPLAEFGATAMSVPMPEVYTNLEKGIIDGFMGPYEVLSSFNLAEVTKYHTAFNMSSCHYAVKLMNMDTWNSLPAEIQQVFEDNVDFWTLQLDNSIQNVDQEGIDYATSLGNEFIELPPEDLQEFYRVWEVEARKGAEALDALGLPGTAIFEEVRRLIELYSE